MRKRVAAVTLALALVACTDDEPAAPGPGSTGKDPAVRGADPGKSATTPASFDPDDAKRWTAFLREMGLRPVSVEVPERGPGTTDDRGIVLLRPRGKVRAEDLVTFRIDTDWGMNGKLRFARGEETLSETSLETDELVTERPFPASVRDALKTGDRLTWSFTASSGESRTAEFEMSDVDPMKELADAASRVDPSNPALLRQLRAEILLERGLSQAAYTEARAVGEEAKSRPAWRIAQAALVSMGTEVSRLGDEARVALRKLDVERPTGRRPK